MTMIDRPARLIETPPVLPPPVGEDVRADLLSDVLKHIRLSGALFLRGSYTAPWGLESPGNCDLVDLLAPGAERLLVFHVVREGEVVVRAQNRRVELSAGDVVILPNADRHVMESLDTSGATSIRELLPPAPWNDIPVVSTGGGGEPAEIVCGYFRCDELLFNAFLRRLPPIFKVRPEGRASVLLGAAIDYALEDGSRSGGVTAMAHVTEMLLSEALRLYADQADDSSGWLAATSDPVVGRALKLLHAEPLRDWSVDELARRSNSSRTVLGERFKALLGQSPMRYLVEWRMQLAADLLRTTSIKLADIAERTGYGSEAAFSRAFSRHVGMSPAQWRDSVQGRVPSPAAA
jgi:AraC-like DNA-binding protein